MGRFRDFKRLLLITLFHKVYWEKSTKQLYFWFKLLYVSSFIIMFQMQKMTSKVCAMWISMHLKKPLLSKEECWISDAFSKDIFESETHSSTSHQNTYLRWTATRCITWVESTYVAHTKSAHQYSQRVIVRLEGSSLPSTRLLACKNGTLFPFSVDLT